VAEVREPDRVRREDLLIGTAELHARLGDADLRVVDVRWPADDQARGVRDYRAGHVPGAVYLHRYRDLAGAHRQVPSPEPFRAAMERAGVGDGTLVVAYDDPPHFVAARLAWALRYYGHPRVRVLDGGWARWRREGRPVTRAVPGPAAARFTPRPTPALLATREWLHASGAVLVDAGRHGTLTADGRAVPGAVALPSTSLATGEGFLPAGALARLATGAGLRPDGPVAVFCAGGLSASAAWLALRLAGYRDVRLYDAFWADHVETAVPPGAQRRSG
jgi:thiosulfate/3-mercaptopyruvate sulfurtransferase